MRLVLYKIIGAIRREEDVVHAISKIDSYTREATSSILPLRQITHVDGIAHMNGKATHILSSELAMGFTSSLRDIYNIENIPLSLELRTIDDVKLRPSYIVGENIRFSENRLTPELSSKLDDEAKKIMNSTNPNDKLTPEIVERNPALKNISEKLSGKSVRTVGGTLITIGVGIAAVCLAVNEHRNRLTACMLYYYDATNVLRRCVIATCTCKAVACSSNCNYCTNDVLQKYLPADMLQNNCEGFTGTADCRNCPSSNYMKANINDDSTLAQDDKSKSSFVRCQKPNFYEALSDLFGGVSDDLLDIVKNSLNGISWLIQKLPLIILCVFIGFILIIIISIIKRFIGSESSSSSSTRKLSDSRENLL